MSRSFLFLALLAAVSPLGATPTDLAAGGYHFAGVDAGQLFGFGDPTYGQLDVAGLNGTVRIASGIFSTIALKSDGSVWQIGDSNLQFASPHAISRQLAVPIQIPNLAGIDRIAAGHRHFLALDSDTGNLFAWGQNGSGQLGNDSLLDLSTPVQVLTGVAAITAGQGFSVAVKANGEVWTWGRNTHGQLGLGDITDRLVPTKVPGITNATSAAAGGNHTLVLLADGTVVAFGDNQFGQLGTGNTNAATSPVAVGGLAGVTSISAGWNHSAALGAAAYLWGRNFEGQCAGGPNSPTQYGSPSVVALASPVTRLICGGSFTIFQLADGSVWGSGSNSDGQLGGSAVADQSDSRKVLTPQLILANADSDNDQLPDAWEIANFGNLDQSGVDDYDHDGTNNRTEYLLGLDPKSGSSFFNVALSGDALQWRGVAGANFVVQTSTTLLENSWSDSSPQAGVDGINSYAIPQPHPDRIFYRVLFITPP